MPSALSTHTLPLLHRLNRDGLAAAAFQDDTLRLNDKSGTTIEQLSASQIRTVTLTSLPLANRLTVLTKEGHQISLNGLDRSTSQALHTSLAARVQDLLNDEAAKSALSIAPEIAALYETVTESLKPTRYMRSTHAEGMAQATATLQASLDDRTRQKLDIRYAASLQWLDQTTDRLNLEKARTRLNEEILQSAATGVRGATKDIVRTGLTDEQATNIAVDEDTTLILAGAGTGKTAVITGKIAHLVRNQGIPPEAILTLAFNRKAALEIRERLPEDLKGTQVSTFHSFALKVVASQGTAPTISKLAQDDFAYTKLDFAQNLEKT